MAYSNRFNFIGTLMFPKADSKRHFVAKRTTKSKKESLSLNVGVKENDHNMAFCEMFGFVNDEIMTMSVDNEKITINWEDRFDEDVMSTVANYKKTVVDFGEDLGGRQEFLSEYDAIAYIRDNIESVKNKKFCLTGQFVVEPYKNNFYTKYKVQKIFVVDDDAKCGLFVNIDAYYNKECVDKADWKKEHIIGLDAYVCQYINKDEGNKYVPLRFVFNCQKLDFENENHVKLIDFKKSFIDVSDKNYVHMVWKCKVINGSEEAEITIDDLTAKQKQMVELGLKSLKDFQKNVYGDKIVEFRLISPELEVKGFEDGVVDTDMKASEFEESLYVAAKDENLDDVMDKAEAETKKETKEKEESSEEVDEDDLFS